MTTIVAPQEKDIGFPVKRLLPSAQQRRKASASTRDDSCDDDREDREVRELDADRGRAGRDVELRLVPQVDEEDRDRRREDEGLRAHARERNRRAFA